MRSMLSAIGYVMLIGGAAFVIAVWLQEFRAKAIRRAYAWADDNALRIVEPRLIAFSWVTPVTLEFVALDAAGREVVVELEVGAFSFTDLRTTPRLVTRRYRVRPKVLVQGY